MDTLALEVMLSDCENPANGPNGLPCDQGVCRDLVAHDLAFVCSCNEGYAGENCAQVASSSSSDSNDKDVAVAAAVTLVAVILVVLLLLFIWRRRRRQRRMRAFSFDDTLDEMKVLMFARCERGRGGGGLIFNQKTKKKRGKTKECAACLQLLPSPSPSFSSSSSSSSFSSSPPPPPSSSSSLSFRRLGSLRPRSRPTSFLDGPFSCWTCWVPASLAKSAKVRRAHQPALLQTLIVPLLLLLPSIFVLTGVYKEQGRPPVPVAVKALKNDSTEQRDALMREAAIQVQFDHNNIVGLVGVVTRGEPILLVLQFCEHGSLGT